MTTVKEKYGFLPTSVWHIPKKNKVYDIFKDDGIPRTNKRTDKSFLPNLKLSEFNPNVAERVIKYWSEEGDIVFDCFSGRATRGLVSIMNKRNYIGYEISPVTYNWVKKQIDGFNCNRLVENKYKFDLRLGDGCEYHSEIEKESIDLIFTCPPYWNLEKYESCEGQLSDCKTYKEFLISIYACINECYRILKQNKFSVWVVSDFRRNGYYSLHEDIINIHRENGFVLWDIVINVLNSPFVSFKAGFNDKQKYTGKTHEYILIFKKLNEATTK